MEQEIAALTRAIQAQSLTIQTLVDSVAEIKLVVLELKEWKPTMVAAVNDLRDEVSELRDQVKQMSRDLISGSKTTELPPLLSIPEHLKRKEAKEESDNGHGPNGHCSSTQHRGKAMGNYTPELPPGNGTNSLHPLPLPSFYAGDLGSRSLGGHYHHRTPPKLAFPQFDGENPKAWRLKCEVYFRVCDTRPNLWVGIATMHFVGNAVLWLQSTLAHTECSGWEEFANAVCAHFGREEF